MSRPIDAGTITVRRARSADLNELAALRAECGLVPSPRGFRDEMERMLNNSSEVCLVASDTSNGGQIVGALVGSYDGRSANVSRLATHPDHRRRGIATALVARFTAALDHPSVSDASVLVLDRTPDADRLWTALAFDHIGDVPAYRPSVRARGTDRRGTA